MGDMVAARRGRHQMVHSFLTDNRRPPAKMAVTPARPLAAQAYDEGRATTFLTLSANWSGEKGLMR
jgi:hypothetical protein